mmetsp:Transcript_5783/g.18354  ORF Transcript_5783/g.18354 Transcript_5783/m.18354 type:complete len:359 (+) Transcript_5783:477-1553(+)
MLGIRAQRAAELERGRGAAVQRFARGPLVRRRRHRHEAVGVHRHGEVQGLAREAGLGEVLRHPGEVTAEEDLVGVLPRVGAVRVKVPRPPADERGLQRRERRAVAGALRLGAGDALVLELARARVERRGHGLDGPRDDRRVFAERRPRRRVGGLLRRSRVVLRRQRRASLQRVEAALRVRFAGHGVGVDRDGARGTVHRPAHATAALRRRGRRLGAVRLQAFGLQAVRGSTVGRGAVRGHVLAVHGRLRGSARLRLCRLLLAAVQRRCVLFVSFRERRRRRRGGAGDVKGVRLVDCGGRRGVLHGSRPRRRLGRLAALVPDSGLGLRHLERGRELGVARGAGVGHVRQRGLEAFDVVA